ncbi:hypothetical protein P3TCK_26055 [Photobacterium profundum 3TCK]|uniref:Uncharacterized protein n=1 Tax=Photobacterium profundum 3TCK TaxID=314280 RepID=Q1Z291_9GAMM|nr:hypothetical protein P3TCK_26055 [Photobacterium profundum 3TCK]
MFVTLATRSDKWKSKEYINLIVTINLLVGVRSSELYKLIWEGASWKIG